MEWTIRAFAFPAEAGTHLPTPEGWKAEFAEGTYSKGMWGACFSSAGQSNSLSGQKMSVCVSVSVLLAMLALVSAGQAGRINAF